MDEIEVPQYFVCPISLQIMKDPVTTLTGITYDRESIEQWLLKAKDHKCPVTKQPLPRGSDLTPNHTLRRLIQAWCSENAAHGVDRIPTPKSPPNKTLLQKLVRNLQLPQLCQSALERLHALATENQRNLKCMVESGVAESMVHLITKNSNELGNNTISLEQSLQILRLLWNSNTIKPLVIQNIDFIKSLTRILQLHVDTNVNLINEAMPVLKSTIELVDSTLLGGLKPEFFSEITRVIKNRSISQQALKSALHILMETCPLGRNRTRIVEARAVCELIELELEKPEKKITELTFNLLAQLCSCADGREQFLSHAAGIAVASKRVLRVSPATDDRTVHVLWLMARYSGSNDVVLEMLRVGAVSKLCMVIQANCEPSLKEKARSILRLHSKLWNNSPCIQVYLLTGHQR
ncbi:E3 ubiquitin-protein ligase PUB23-like [Prosopis cineraria]|uniref:E3 ubiquitin-protein ligase PUB23-like n=1 Tax=Prosopis cineraria TaxID=364024 RepID=UPI00240F0E9D|nr:E3 ubiquitin-protein ligase PUB23-like [Prosopis cineraria]